MVLPYDIFFSMNSMDQILKESVKTKDEEQYLLDNCIPICESYKASDIKLPPEAEQTQANKNNETDTTDDYDLSDA